MIKMNFVDLLNEYHIMPQFPPSVVNWTQTLPKSVEDVDKKGRIDLTDKTIITIDGDDAKDFDDAVSLELLENGNFYLGVHIADVTHYVPEGSAMDRAALSRGTSVYLIDTVIPMLPFELSNELCSLKPNEVRLTVSVFMEITTSGIVKDYKICKSFIRSRHRMTYHNVTKILENDEGLALKYTDIVPMLKLMKELAGVLNKKRVKEGSIEFITHESKITLDKNGEPLVVEKYPITISNNIIEEFMLMANVTVAKHLTSKGLPCVYRIHESPDLERIEKLAKVLPVLGVEFKFKMNMMPKDFQGILKSVESSDVEDVVNYLALRAMSRAKYSERNLGHFGLGFSDYCHFTSPIRRYPDIVVHRVLKESLEGELTEKRVLHFKELAISASVTASITEGNSADAELRWKDIKKAEYMAKHIGEKYSAAITHVTGSGFFAELENTVEGFVAVRSIEDDAYIMSEDGLSLVGMRTKRSFTIGDRVKIKVVYANPDEEIIDFELVGGGTLKPQQSKKRGRNTKNKKSLSREEKQKLRRLNEEDREERMKRREVRQKAELEKTIFENAVVYEIFELLKKYGKFKKAEVRYIVVMLQDLAAVISMPVYKSNSQDRQSISLENSMVSASVNTKNVLETIFESFGLEDNDGLIQRSQDFVKAALRHFDKCMKAENIDVKARENEYDSIIKK